MTRHFANLPERDTVGERDSICSALFKSRDSPNIDRSFHESGHVRFYLTAEGQRMEELACIHCGRVFDDEATEARKVG